VPELAGLTSEGAGAAVSAARLAIVPIGSCEQHGPHLNLDTDTAIAAEFARRLGSELGDVAVLCPVIGYGLSEHHMAFAGTLTLRPATLIAVLSDLAESLASWGLDRILIVNGHGGNIDAIRLACRSARRDHGVLMASVMWAQLAADAIAERVTSTRYGHACEIETSVALVLAPQTVRTERIRPPRLIGGGEPFSEPPSPRVDQPVWFEEWTEDGALGDPRLASSELGTAIVDVALERALAFARRFADAEPADGA
jgi:creatinine amidohydrolase